MLRTAGKVNAAREDKVKWIDANRKVLINLLLKNFNGGYAKMANDKGAWAKVVTDFKRETGLSYDKTILTSQCTTLK